VKVTVVSNAVVRTETITDTVTGDGLSINVDPNTGVLLVTDVENNAVAAYAPGWISAHREA